MSNLLIRAADKSDLDDIVRVNLAALMEQERLATGVRLAVWGEAAEKETLNEWRKILRKIDKGRKAAGTIQLAFHDAAMAGFVWHGPGRDEGLKGEGEIRALYVDPGFWGRGAGRELFARAADALRGQGHKRLYLWTEDDNRLSHAFYGAVGGQRDEKNLRLFPNGLAAVMFRWE